ncbi:MAG: transposase [Chloroflexi bacterium]|nr:transposase [Chloroflexota bacterium]
MNDTTWDDFRHAIYDCFLSNRDALFELIDALLSEDRAGSLPELSLSPFFRRQWPSLYQALQDGRIDRQRLREVLVRFLPVCPGCEHLWISVDASSIVRAYAHTSPDRSIVHVANPGPRSKPVHFGWQFSTVMLLPDQPSSWTYILDQHYIPSQGSAVKTAIEQLQAIAPKLERLVTIVADSGYGTQAFLLTLILLGLEGLIRLKVNRVFFRRPHTSSMDSRGHPARFQCNDPSTHGPPTRHLEVTSKSGKPILLDCWEGLHLKGGTDQTISIVRISRPGASGSERDPRESWFAWVGNRPAPLQELWQRYACRYSHEHCYRFLKQDLLWADPQLRCPEQFERWSQVVMLAFNQLVLAKDSCEPVLMPWERAQTPLTPRRVRRGMEKLLCKVGTPTRAPQRRGRAPGRAAGFHPKAAPRYPVLAKRRGKPPPGKGKTSRTNKKRTKAA